MPDVFDRETRSRMMAGIRSKDTQPEMIVRRGLHSRGFRYRLHPKNTPGRPDMVLTRHRAVIMIHGCFWHMHQCAEFRWPKSRKSFWKAKLERNHARDEEVRKLLRNGGWRVLTIWECALRKTVPGRMEKLFLRIEKWLRGTGKSKTIAGG